MGRGGTPFHRGPEDSEDHHKKPVVSLLTHLLCHFPRQVKKGSFPQAPFVLWDALSFRRRINTMLLRDSHKVPAERVHHFPFPSDAERN